MRACVHVCPPLFVFCEHFIIQSLIRFARSSTHSFAANILLVQGRIGVEMYYCLEGSREKIM